MVRSVTVLDFFALIKPIVFNGKPEHLFALVLDIPLRIQHIHSRVDSGANFGCLVIFVNEMTYRYEISYVVVPGADKRGGEVSLYTLYLVDIRLELVVGRFHWFGASILDSPTLERT